MSEPTASDVDAFLDRAMFADDPVLTAAQADADAAGLPAIQVSPQQGKLLYLLAVMSGARRVLEIGTLAGYSAIWLARAVGPEGRVVTLEYQPRHAEVARANLQRAGLADRVNIIVGVALDTLPTLSGEPFDFVFIDADKENNSAYVQWAVDRGHPGTVIVVDNVIRDGLILDPPSGDTAAEGSRDVLTMMGAHPRLEVAAIQTVGVKGWDGFALAVVR